MNNIAKLENEPRQLIGALVHYFFKLAFGVESRFRPKVVEEWTTMRELSVNAAPLIAEYAFKQACPRDVEM